MSAIRTTASRAILVAAIVAGVADPLLAQGSLSTQGFGYPTGQIGTRSRGSAGANAEFDPVSPINPASLGEWTRPTLYFQYEPEFRRVTNGAARDNATVIRFPLFAGGLPFMPGGTLGLSASTLLDRSWATTSNGKQTFDDTVIVDFTDNFQSLGALTDVRLASSYAPHRSLRIGLGLHAVTGQNKVVASRTFASGQATFAPFFQSASITYTGSAISAGFIWRPTATLGIAGSAKRGGSLKASTNDSTIGRGRVPDRVGGSLLYLISTGTQISVRADRVWWSRLTPLSRSFGRGTATGRDGWELGAGIEGRGPVVFSRPIQLRLGGDRRTLPFLAAGAEVTETLVAGGFGVPLAFGRASLDAAVQRAARDASGSGIRERAWILSLGLTVRP